LSRELGEDRKITAILNLLDSPFAEDPGGKTLESVQEDRRAAMDTRGFYDYSPVAIDAGQAVDQQVIGLQYQDLSAGPGALTLKGFYLHRDYQQQLAFAGGDRDVTDVQNDIAYDRDYYGGSAEYRQSLTLAGLPFRYMTGVDVARQVDDRHSDDVLIDGGHVRRSRDETSRRPRWASSPRATWA